jgi:phytoene synthase
MIDTAVSGSLASAETFEARFRRVDELRWLASRYAPAEGRRTLAALGLLHHELLRALGTSEPMLGKIRIQWWRETLEGLMGGQAPRRHDLSEELSIVLLSREAVLIDLFRLLDRFDETLEDHLSAGGHQNDADHEARHLACEAAATLVFGRALDADAAGIWREALEACGEAALSLRAGLPEAGTRLASARDAIRGAPAALWPAVAHLAALGCGAGAGPLRQRFAIFHAVLRARL